VSGNWLLDGGVGNWFVVSLYDSKTQQPTTNNQQPTTNNQQPTKMLRGRAVTINRTGAGVLFHLGDRWPLLSIRTNITTTTRTITTTISSQERATSSSAITLPSATRYLAFFARRCFHSRASLFHIAEQPYSSNTINTPQPLLRDAISHCRSFSSYDDSSIGRNENTSATSVSPKRKRRASPLQRRAQVAAATTVEPLPDDHLLEGIFKCKQTYLGEVQLNLEAWNEHKEILRGRVMVTFSYDTFYAIGLIDSIDAKGKWIIECVSRVDDDNGGSRFQRATLPISQHQIAFQFPISRERITWNQLAEIAQFADRWMNTHAKSEKTLVNVWRRVYAAFKAERFTLPQFVKIVFPKSEQARTEESDFITSLDSITSAYCGLRVLASASSLFKSRVFAISLCSHTDIILTC